MKKMKALINENSGQGAAEYILLFGGVIVIALAGLLIYRSYFSILFITLVMLFHI